MCMCCWRGGILQFLPTLSSFTLTFHSFVFSQYNLFSVLPSDRGQGVVSVDIFQGTRHVTYRNISHVVWSLISCEQDSTLSRNINTLHPHIGSLIYFCIDLLLCKDLLPHNMICNFRSPRVCNFTKGHKRRTRKRCKASVLCVRSSNTNNSLEVQRKVS